MSSINHNSFRQTEPISHTLSGNRSSILNSSANRPIPDNQSVSHIAGNNATDSALNKRKKLKLLVVDDDDVDRERIGRYLKKFKLPVIVLDASNGSDAMQQVLHSEIDLILLDYQLGDMTGTDLLNQIQQQESTIIPTVMITGMGDEQTAIEAMRLGVFDYLPKKALTAESLIAVLEAALHASDLEKKLEESQTKLLQMSLYDELTGLANRNLFFDRLEQALLSSERNDSQFTVLMIDLNRFKEINDSLGHLAGDDVLKTIGDRLQACARKSDTVARLGGDEFVCILLDIQTSKGATTCINKLIDAISMPIAVTDRVVQVGASIGVAHYPEHGIDASTLLSNADSAMYHAKKANRNYAIYNEFASNATNNIPVCQSLYKGIKAKELFLEYQPKIDLSTQQILGAEVLVRWRSPKFGLVMPGDFIPAAERSNLIEHLTYATMEMAFEQMAQWYSDGFKLKLALNISARMLDHEKLPDRLIAELACKNLCANDIVLEITETTLASSGSCAHKVLMELIEAGFEISIDDFGSGFTSFRYIRDIEFAELKIDRLFINKIQIGSRDAEIVHSMILLAEGLGMRAVAEGVETQEQWKLLGRLGCKYGQGYGIARPMPAIDLVAWQETIGQVNTVQSNAILN